MNKLFLLIAGILLMGVVIGGGGVIVNGLTSKNVELTYPATKSPTETFTKTQMLDFNDVKYEIKENTIILNKKNLFQNREVKLIEEQTCLDYNRDCTEWSVAECLEYAPRPTIECLELQNPKQPLDIEKNPCLKWEDWKRLGCLEFDEKKGECLKWEREADCLTWSEIKCLKFGEKYCVNWTKYTKDDFVQQAIKKEIEFVKGIQIARANRTPTDVNQSGKLVIK